MKPQNGWYTFLGKDSNGYTNGRTYYLEFAGNLYKLFNMMPPSWKIVIKQPYTCPYASTEVFYKNWVMEDELWTKKGTY